MRWVGGSDHDRLLKRKKNKKEIFLKIGFDFFSNLVSFTLTPSPTKDANTTIGRISIIGPSSSFFPLITNSKFKFQIKLQKAH